MKQCVGQGSDELTDMVDFEIVAASARQQRIPVPVQLKAFIRFEAITVALWDKVELTSQPASPEESVGACQEPERQLISLEPGSSIIPLVSVIFMNLLFLTKMPINTISFLGVKIYSLKRGL